MPVRTGSREEQMTRQPGPQAKAPRVLFAAAEIFPMAKTGGLADVSAALPGALGRLGVDVRLLMPGYPGAREQLVAAHVAADLGEVLPGAPVRLVAGWSPDSGLPGWLVDCPPLYHRPGTLYQDPEGRDWPDNALRFGLLCHVAALLGSGRAGVDWRPDIVHANDWHTGLVPLLLGQAGPDRPRTVFTVHNVAFQGNFPLAVAEGLQLPPGVLGPDGIEFYGQVSFLKAGIRYADKVTTVSPTHARELLTPEFGFGMEGLFRERGEDFTGIMNGIDARVWNPDTDAHLSACQTSAGAGLDKSSCKARLQQQAGLDPDPQAPLVVYVSRLTHQKMADVVLKHLPDILDRHPRLQFALHGQGERALEEGFRELAHRYEGRLSVRIGYAEPWAHLLHAGADILLHGSRFEPCGLTQMYAMRYGTIPIVSRVGGLADSVVDAGTSDAHVEAATGFVFDEPNGEAMESALARCLDTYMKRPTIWSALRSRAMAEDFSWSFSARKYARLYSELMPQAGLAAGARPARSQAEGRDVRAASFARRPRRQERGGGLPAGSDGPATGSSSRAA